jgi:hypothetical protein
VVFETGSSRGSAIVTIQDIVTGSGGTAFVSRNLPIPDWWPSAARSITTDIESRMPEILQQHDAQREKAENTLRKQLTRIAGTVFWIFIPPYTDNPVGNV